jgi:hypothetical protein
LSATSNSRISKTSGETNNWVSDIGDPKMFQLTSFPWFLSHDSKVCRRGCESVYSRLKLLYNCESPWFLENNWQLFSVYTATKKPCSFQ